MNFQPPGPNDADFWISAAVQRVLKATLEQLLIVTGALTGEDGELVVKRKEGIEGDIRRLLARAKSITQAALKGTTTIRPRSWSPTGILEAASAARLEVPAWSPPEKPKVGSPWLHAPSGAGAASSAGESTSPQRRGAAEDDDERGEGTRRAAGESDGISEEPGQGGGENGAVKAANVGDILQDVGKGGGAAQGGWAAAGQRGAPDRLDALLDRQVEHDDEAAVAAEKEVTGEKAQGEGEEGESVPQTGGEGGEEAGAWGGSFCEVDALGAAAREAALELEATNGLAQPLGGQLASRLRCVFNLPTSTPVLILCLFFSCLDLFLGQEGGEIVRPCAIARFCGHSFAGGSSRVFTRACSSPRVCPTGMLERQQQLSRAKWEAVVPTGWRTC